MIHLFETGIEGKIGVYVTMDEQVLIDRLERRKDLSAVYYRRGRPMAKHWLLNPITLARMGLDQPMEKLRDE